MYDITDQMKKWISLFGKDYTNRNSLTLREMDQIYKKNYGVTRTELNKLFLDNLDRSIKILEVGSNMGNQLLNLQKMKFENLYGIEINTYAIKMSKSRTQNINIIQASAFDIPFKNDFFDLVFTSGLLIHISPTEIKRVLKEIYRCTKKYIWGFEYCADTYTEVIYREQKNFLWKTNFHKLYIDLFRDLQLVKIKQVKYLNDENVDEMFLLKKYT